MRIRRSHLLTVLALAAVVPVWWMPTQLGRYAAGIAIFLAWLTALRISGPPRDPASLAEVDPWNIRGHVLVWFAGISLVLVAIGLILAFA